MSVIDDHQRHQCPSYSFALRAVSSVCTVCVRACAVCVHWSSVCVALCCVCALGQCVCDSVLCVCNWIVCVSLCCVCSLGQCVCGSEPACLFMASVDAPQLSGSSVNHTLQPLKRPREEDCMCVHVSVCART